MKNLTIIFVTARKEPCIEWFKDSIARQCDTMPEFIVIDANGIHGQKPKPTLWQGEHRVMGQDWWANSNSRNTGLAQVQTEWVAFVDDRSVPAPSWMDAVRDAMEGRYIVAGSYEKRHNMKVENGKIIDPGTRNSMDNRWEHMEKEQLPNPYQCAGNWVYGCGIAMPTEWALQVGGFEEAMDGSGFEDCIFGMMCANNGYPICYDMRMHLIEDRTPELIGTTYRREDKGISPNDKSHRSLDLFGTAKNTSNRHLLLQSRQFVQRGEPFPKLFNPREDWFDGQPIVEIA